MLAFALMVLISGIEAASGLLEDIVLCKEDPESASVLQVSRNECAIVESPDDKVLSSDWQYRIRCKESALEASQAYVWTTLERSLTEEVLCSNAVVTASWIILTHLQLDRVTRARVHHLFFFHASRVFLIDNSIWPVKTVDIEEYFNLTKKDAQSFTGSMPSDAGITFMVNNLTPEVRKYLDAEFPEMQKQATVTEVMDWQDIGDQWKLFETVPQPLGMALNVMATAVPTDLVFVVVDGLVPDRRGMAELRRILDYVQVAGGYTVSNRVYTDFCRTLEANLWRLSIKPRYEMTLDLSRKLDEDEGGTAMRGHWYADKDSEETPTPSKLCHTTSPSFLARKATLSYDPMTPFLDGQWAVLDWFFHLSVHLHKVHVAFSTAVQLTQLPGFPKVFLYARQDTLMRDEIRERFYSDDMAKKFAHRNEFRELEALDGEIHPLGCSLKTENCPLPQWMYRGWPMPPCCRRTLMFLLFYIHDVFKEMGIRYILTDGALLGSFKVGGYLIWDADIDLHIHSDDFHRLKTDVRERILKDGYFIRQHETSAESYLLQANKDNYLLVELNKRQEQFDDSLLVPFEGRLFPTHMLAARNLSQWYGNSFLTNRLRYIPPWEEVRSPLFCGTPFHHNCLPPHFPPATDCRREGLC
eukprot:GEMP01016817.1.p1 GENE.GEMP01016817.1~~GEMP01016817.1.p1  ORF type:complete len:641 (+),score=109.15 GEMP01016817.1:157-2079(+)